MSAVVKLVALLCTTFSVAAEGAATWCVVRSDARELAMLTALNYACGGGADCAPIQPSGLCYLPNTVQAHASYAFNSYYQRRAHSPDSCSFGAIATIAVTDPSYGSCVYPSSPRTAGGIIVAPGGPSASTTSTPGGSTERPAPPATTMPLYGGGGGQNPGVEPMVSNSPTTNVTSNVSIRTIFSRVIFLLVCLFHIM